nr:MAG TPA: regulatory protein [Caudoviricetes sp.]
MQDMNENVYFECRKRAAIHNERLNSRAGAAELLGISESTLAHYELGITKSVPVDIIVMMSELYGAPELKCHYCKKECPIGESLPIATEVGTIENITVRMLNGLDENKIDEVKRKLLNIASDGKVDEQEREELAEVVSGLDDLYKVISELRMMTEQQAKTERK